MKKKLGAVPLIFGKRTTPSWFIRRPPLMGERWFYASKNKEIRKDISIFASEVFSFCATKYCLANFTYNSDSREATLHQQERHCFSFIQNNKL
ncbi:MAG: hypothetical protein SOY99_03480 [Alloprevotella sp.]|nr:hypothetical protein [Alloprevotella sp.]